MPPNQSQAHQEHGQDGDSHDGGSPNRLSSRAAPACWGCKFGGGREGGERGGESHELTTAILCHCQQTPTQTSTQAHGGGRKAYIVTQFVFVAQSHTNAAAHLRFNYPFRHRIHSSKQTFAPALSHAKHETSNKGTNAIRMITTGHSCCLI